MAPVSHLSPRPPEKARAPKRCSMKREARSLITNDTCVTSFRHSNSRQSRWAMSSGKSSVLSICGTRWEGGGDGGIVTDSAAGKATGKAVRKRKA
eukprot:scaffold2080_cov118-Isochrysis_galbana.AAC.2